jgi:ATP-binding cassette subfamily E protein 1
LGGVLEREVKDLSGGELQRFAIGVVCVKKADVYVPLRILSTHLICL